MDTVTLVTVEGVSVRVSIRASVRVDVSSFVSVCVLGEAVNKVAVTTGTASRDFEDGGGR